MRSFVGILHLLSLASVAVAYVGTAAHYSPPYLPSDCYGNDGNQYPSDGYFAAAGNAIWDGGVACDRTYQVKCISGPPGTCNGQVITIKIVDHAVSGASAANTELILSETAYQAITNKVVPEIGIEFVQI